MKLWTVPKVGIPQSNAWEALDLSAVKENSEKAQAEASTTASLVYNLFLQFIKDKANTQ